MGFTTLSSNSIWRIDDIFIQLFPSFFAGQFFPMIHILPFPDSGSLLVISVSIRYTSLPTFTPSVTASSWVYSPHNVLVEETEGAVVGRGGPSRSKRHRNSPVPVSRGIKCCGGIHRSQKVEKLRGSWNCILLERAGVSPHSYSPGLSLRTSHPIPLLSRSNINVEWC